MSVLRDRSAAGRLSPFRLDKLNAHLGEIQPGLVVVSARFWHFVETARGLTEREGDILARLLTYGAPPGPAGRTVLVTPRLGTISPWSSKATDIARQCGLAAVRRIERGTAFDVSGEGDIGPVVPLLHDRMTEAVLPSLEAAGELFQHHAPRPLTEVDVLARGRAAIEEANAAFGLALAPDEIDYLVSYFAGRRRNPTDVDSRCSRRRTPSTRRRRSSTHRGRSTACRRSNRSSR